MCAQESPGDSNTVLYKCNRQFNLYKINEIKAQSQAPMYSLSRQSSSGGSSGGLPMPEHSIVAPNGLQGSHSMLSQSSAPSTSTPHPDPLMIQQRQTRPLPNEPIFNYLNNPINPPRSNPCDPNMTIPGKNNSLTLKKPLIVLG